MTEELKLKSAYTVLQDEFIKQVPVGSTVKIVRKAKNYELGWNNTWDDPMDGFIGKECEVMEYDRNSHNRSSGIKCYCHKYNNWYVFPFFVLEVVEIKDKCEFKPFDQVLVRDNISLPWRCAYFSYFEPRVEYPYYTTDDSFKMCILYKGNEHLVNKKG